MTDVAVDTTAPAEGATNISPRTGKPKRPYNRTGKHAKKAKAVKVSKAKKSEPSSIYTPVTGNSAAANAKRALQEFINTLNGQLDKAKAALGNLD